MRIVLVLATAVIALSGCDASNDEEELHDRSALADPAAEGMRINALRAAIIENGFVQASELSIPTDARLREAGSLIFDSTLMSLNSEISCRDCHLDEFGSSDGLPNAVGVGGSGSGRERLESGGRILPRNVLPLWGRGGRGFDTLFWDGKVELVDRQVVSQFGYSAPSNDPLVVAAHLPSVELDEMVSDTDEVREEFVQEEVGSAQAIQRELAERFAADPTIGPMLVAAIAPDKDIEFLHVAEALAAFIRHEFRIQETQLERFAYQDGPISQSALNGGILFYGRGRCSACHSGPYFSDFDFHAVAFPQAGFGRNGFGIDEGRYNVSHNPDDRYLFRTPPLFNVSKTGPYSHSGAVGTVRDSIIAHFDPLRLVSVEDMTATQRVDLYRRLGRSGQETLPSELTDDEVEDLVNFLLMLEF